MCKTKLKSFLGNSWLENSNLLIVLKQNFVVMAGNLNVLRFKNMIKIHVEKKNILKEK